MQRLRRATGTLAALSLASILGASACGTAGSATSNAGATSTSSGALTGAGGSSSSTGTASSASSGSGGSIGVGGSSVSSSTSTSGSTSTSSGGAGGSPVSNIKHVVVIVQENHTFDTHFGNYCTAAAGSNPTCNAGPSCCEGAPATDPNGVAPTVLDDAENAGYDPNHTQACELSEMNGGKMDMYTGGPSCADKRNFAVTPASVAQPYWDLATRFALADRYFQPIVGQSSSNDMYLAQAKYAFTDNAYFPDTNGKGCTVGAFGPFIQYTNPTIGDLLVSAGLNFAFYAEGYAAMKASSTCPAAPADCPFGLPTNPCDYDPSDVPFEYYKNFADNSTYMLDYQDFVKAIGTGQIPQLSFIKGVGYHNEHPGYDTTISQGVTFVTTVVNSILASPIAEETLVLITWDEGGGFFDHVTPPAPSTIDNQPYGTRIPLLALGRFAKQNFVSHVELEHSSIVAFVEQNFLGAVGQLGGRDAVVHNLGSMLDPTQTGITIPE